MPDDDQPTTQELKVVQLDKLEAERERAREAEDQDAEHAHERRADRAAYLAEKLDEQERTLEQ